MLIWLLCRQKICTAYFSVIKPIPSFLFWAWAKISGSPAKRISGSYIAIDQWVWAKCTDTSRSWAHAFSLSFSFLYFTLYEERIPHNSTPPINQRLLFHKWYWSLHWFSVQLHCSSTEVNSCSTCLPSAFSYICCSFRLWCSSVEAQWEASYPSLVGTATCARVLEGASSRKFKKAAGNIKASWVKGNGFDLRLSFVLLCSRNDTLDRVVQSQ